MSIPQLFVALDIDDTSHLNWLLGKLHGLPLGYKIGHQRFDERLVRQLVADKIPVFLDTKTIDTRDTVEAAFHRYANLGVSYATVTAKNRAVLKAAIRGSQGSPLVPLATTILSDDTQTSIEEEGYDGWTLDELARHRAFMAVDCGIRGLIVSGTMLGTLHANYKNTCTFATPGIRRPRDMANNHTNLLTPEQAIAQGSNILVVGRPITDKNVKNPRREAEDFLTRAGITPVR